MSNILKLGSQYANGRMYSVNNKEYLQHLINEKVTFYDKATGIKFTPTSILESADTALLVGKVYPNTNITSSDGFSIGMRAFTKPNSDVFDIISWDVVNSESED